MLRFWRRKTRLAPTAWLAVVGWLLPTLGHTERLRIEIGGANFRPYPVAVPAISAAAPSSQQAQQTTHALREGVELARSLALVPPSSYLEETPPAAKTGSPLPAVDYQAWLQVGASGLIRGQLTSSATEQVQLNLRFFDVNQRSEALQQNCSARADKLQLCVYRFLDEVVAYLTGEKGIFSSRIVFVKKVGRYKHLFTCDVSGSDVQRLTDNASLNLLPTWEPNGLAILFTSYLQGNPDLYRLRLASKGLEPVSHFSGLNTGAAVSPDGKQIALTLSRDGNTEIYVLESNGKNFRRLTDSWGQDVSPSWSPDGKQIAFVSSRSGNPHIYVMDSNGKNPRRLTFQGTYNQEPDWSPRPDGRIAFTARDENLKYDVFLVHPVSGALTRLTQDNGHNESPAHSPDGHHLVFTSTRRSAAHKELWVMHVDGQAQRPLRVGAGDYETPSWGPRLGYANP